MIQQKASLRILQRVYNQQSLRSENSQPNLPFNKDSGVILLSIWKKLVEKT